MATHIKTGGDPFINKTATKQMKENYGQLLNNIYSVFVKGISEAEAGKLRKLKNN